MNKWIRRALIAGAVVAAAIALLVIGFAAWISTCDSCFQIG